MAHRDQSELVNLIRQEFPEHFTGTRVLEVGSLDINGSIRKHFIDCDYIGLDVGEGPGVDFVISGDEYDGPDSSFDVTISCECMEHNPRWSPTISNMARLLKPGGLLIISCATTGRQEHGTSKSNPGDSPLTIALGQDYYRNLSHGDFATVPGYLDSFAKSSHWVNWSAWDYYFVGVKAGSADVDTRWHSLVSAVDSWIEARNSSPSGRLRERLTAHGQEHILHRLSDVNKAVRKAVTRHLRQARQRDSAVYR